MVSVVIAYHSGYGHTRRMAEAVHAGAASVGGVEAHLLTVQDIDADGWARLAAADAIVFGSPTYMGNVSGPFKTFADATSRIWLTQGWKDKLAGGFTCSLNMSGDKMLTLQYLATLASQHGMVWVGTGLPAPSEPGAPDQLNRLSSGLGPMGQAGNVPPEVEPPEGDLLTCQSFGRRIADAALRWNARP